MSRQKKCLYQKIIALVCLFAVCLTGFAAYFAIKNTWDLYRQQNIHLRIVPVIR